MMQVFVGAKLFDGARMLEDAALVCDGDRVVAVTRHAERPRGASETDLGGGVLAPGLVDWQVNGGGGVLFNANPTPEGIGAIVAAHRRFGTTALLPTVITDSPHVLNAALQAAREAHARLPGALGIHAEGPFIDVRRKGAHPAQFIRAMNEADAGALIAARAGAMVVTLAPASVSNALIAKLAQAGIIVSLGHAECTFDEARAGFDAGARAATHLYNAMSQLGHREPGLAGAAMDDARIQCGLIADGCHVHDAAMRIAIKAKGPGALALVSDAMPPAAGGPDRFELGGRAVRRDGLRLAYDDGTLAGAAITMIEAVRYLVAHVGAPLEDALQMATLTPARLLRLDGTIGCLRPGRRADLLHLDEALGVRGVWIGGEAQPAG